MSHILCKNKKSLIYLINHNTITIHRWLSKYTDPTSPDTMVIDKVPPMSQTKNDSKRETFFINY
jgi:bifunctional non-homologous end joining protein LigD